MMDEEKIFIEFASNLIKDTLNLAVKKVAQAIKGVKRDFEVKTGKAFQNYYETAINKYIKTKTILYRETPRYLYDFYINMELIGSGGHYIETSNINNVLIQGNLILITGTAGCGKSTLLKHLFLNAIEGRTGIPLFFEMKNVSKIHNKFEDFICESLNECNFDMDQTEFLALLKTGNFIIFLDAFDEVDQRIALNVSKRILSFVDKYHKNSYIVSSRPDERYISWSRFTELTVAPFNRTKCLELIDKLDYDRAIKSEFYNLVKEKLYESHKSFLANPLLTTIMLMTYDQFGNIPNKMHLFYNQAFETLFHKHDATKTGFRRKMFSDLEIDKFTKVFAGFCIQSYLKNEFTFTQETMLDYIRIAKKIIDINIEFDEVDFFNDLLKSLCIIIQDGLKYAFTHRTFQEYFSALYICNVLPHRRREFLTKIQDKMTIDNTVSLVMDIDRNSFENDYLIEALDNIRNHYAEIEKLEDQAYKFYKDMCLTIYLRADGVLDSYTLNDENCYSRLVDFVHYHYSDYCSIPIISYDRIDSNIKSFYRLYCNVKSGAIMEKDDIKAKRKLDYFLKSNDTITINLNAIEDAPKLYEAFLQHMVYFLRKYIFAINVLEKIKQNKHDREKSIDNFLFNNS